MKGLLLDTINFYLVFTTFLMLTVCLRFHLWMCEITLDDVIYNFYFFWGGNCLPTSSLTFFYNYMYVCIFVWNIQHCIPVISHIIFRNQMSQSWNMSVWQMTWMPSLAKMQLAVLLSIQRLWFALLWHYEKPFGNLPCGSCTY